MTFTDLDIDVIRPIDGAIRHQLFDRLSYHLIRNVDTRGVEQRGRQINERTHLRELSAAHESEASNRSRHPNRSIVAGAFVFVVAGLEMAAVIRGEEDDCIFIDLQTLE